MRTAVGFGSVSPRELSSASPSACGSPLSSSPLLFSLFSLSLCGVCASLPTSTRQLCCSFNAGSFFFFGALFFLKHGSPYLSSPPIIRLSSPDQSQPYLTPSSSVCQMASSPAPARSSAVYPPCFLFFPPYCLPHHPRTTPPPPPPTSSSFPPTPPPPCCAETGSRARAGCVSLAAGVESGGRARRRFLGFLSCPVPTNHTAAQHSRGRGCAGEVNFFCFYCSFLSGSRFLFYPE